MPIDSVAFVSDATLAIDFQWTCEGHTDPNSHHLETTLTGGGGSGGVADFSSTNVSGALLRPARVAAVTRTAASATVAVAEAEAAEAAEATETAEAAEAAEAAEVAATAAAPEMAAPEQLYRLPRAGGVAVASAIESGDMWRPYRATGLTLKVAIEIAPETSGDRGRGAVPTATIPDAAASRERRFTDGSGGDEGGGDGDDSGSIRISRPRALTREPTEGHRRGGGSGGGGSGTRRHRHRRSESDCAGGRWGFGLNGRGGGRGFFAERLFGRSRTDIDGVEDHDGDRGAGGDGGGGGGGGGSDSRRKVDTGGGAGLDASGGGGHAPSVVSHLTIQVDEDPYGDPGNESVPPERDVNNNHNNLDGPASCPERSFGAQVGFGFSMMFRVRAEGEDYMRTPKEECS